MTTAALSRAAQASKRLWELDALRGLAIVLMVFYHFIWDLNYFGLYQATLIRGPWQIFARSIATLFIFVLGVSLTLRFNKLRRRPQTDDYFVKYLLRGAKIFGWGLVITVATYFFIGRGFVIFGILHLLGLSVVAGYPFLHLNKWGTLTAGVIIIGLGIYVDGLVAQGPWLIWLGVKQAGRTMVDYYPVLPWFGVALLGIFAGHSLYPNGQPAFSRPPLGDLPPIQALRFLGRHSLLIYLIHQPILIGLFLALGFG